LPNPTQTAPSAILDSALEKALSSGNVPVITAPPIVADVEYVSRNIQNRAGVRLLLACLLAKVHNPAVDVRKPYTEIGDADAFSGRTYDEAYITPFINLHDLPCNPTTAFLTPALRNRNTTLTLGLNLVGRPPKLYDTILKLLDAVYRGVVAADVLLAETLRWLLIVRDEKRQRMETLLAGLRTTEGAIPLSSEGIVNLIEQHFKTPNSSRLPVLVVAAAYLAASAQLGEKPLTLSSHNAADGKPARWAISKSLW
jgi:hypothetical protein